MNLAQLFRLIRGGSGAPPPDPDPEIQTLVPGDVAFGSWTAGSWPSSATGKQGTPGVGYDCRAKGAWMNPVNMTVRGGEYLLGVQAYQQMRRDLLRNSSGIANPFGGIQAVRFSIDNGPTTTVTVPSIHPETGREGFFVRIDATAWSAPKRCEVRAEVVPWHGDPFVLEGFPDPHLSTGSATPGGYRRMNTVLDMWSLPINVDPDGASLPRAVVWKAPSASSAGSDSNSGLSKSAPLKTWRAVINKIKEIHGTDDVGGATIYLTDAANHDFGLSDWTGAGGVPQASDILKCASQWLRVVADPDTARGEVAVTSATTYGLCCEKLWVEFAASATIANTGTTTNVTALKYFDMAFHRFDFDGGPEVDPIAGLPEGPMVAVLPNGYSYFIDSTATRTRLTNFYEMVHLERAVISHTGQYGDVLWNAKVIDAVTMSDIRDLPDGSPGDTGQHVDLLQLVNQRRMMIWRDFEATSNVQAQLLYADRPSRPEQIALIRPRFANSGGYYVYAMFGSEGLKDHFVYDPEILGNTQLFAETPRNLSINGGPAQASYGVQYVYLSDADKESGIASYITPWMQGRYGQSYLAPWLEDDQAEAQPSVSTFQQGIADANIPAVFDVQIAGRMDLQWSQADLAWEVHQWKNNSTYGWGGSDPGGTGFQYAASTTTFVKGAAARAPLLRDDALWGAVLEFNGVNTGALSGMALTSNNAGFPVEYRPTGENAEFDVLMALIQDDTADQTVTRTLWAAGGTASSGFNSIDLKRVVVSGKQHLVVGCGVGPSGTTAGAARVTLSTQSLSGSPDISGRCRLRIEKRIDRLKLTLWHALFTDGVTIEATYGAGNIATINGGRMNLGGTTVNAAGSNGQWPKMRIAPLYYCDALYVDPDLEAEKLAAFASAYPLSAP